MSTKMLVVLSGTVPLVLLARNANSGEPVPSSPQPPVLEASLSSVLPPADLDWDASASHPEAHLTISGADFRYSKKFEQGQAPSFDAASANLTSGVYSYRIEFVPAGFLEDRDAKRELDEARVNLPLERERLYQSGDLIGARRIDALLAEKKAEYERVTSRLQSGFDDQVIVETGQVLIDERGNVLEFDMEAIHARAMAEEVAREIKDQEGEL